jgi:hypothetical protein
VSSPQQSVQRDGDMHTHVCHHRVARDASGSITTASVSQQMVTVPCCGYEVFNCDPVYDLWVCDNGRDAAAFQAGSIRIAAGGSSYCTPSDMQPLNQVVKIMGFVAGQQYTARYW